jgi:uncharacterized protein YndB with AHSA1/START domain
MPDIHHLIQIQAKPETMFPLIATPGGLSKWWAEDVFDETSTECSLGFFNRGTIYRLSRQSGALVQKVVWKCESGKEWQGTTITFEVAPSAAGSSLRFAHAGWQAETDYFTSCNTTWGELMFRLMAVAQSQNVGPLFRKSGIGY